MYRIERTEKKEKSYIRTIGRYTQVKNCDKNINCLSNGIFIDSLFYEYKNMYEVFIFEKYNRIYIFINSKNLLILEDGIFTSLDIKFEKCETIGDVEIVKDRIYVLYHAKKHFIRVYDLDFNFISEEILSINATHIIFLGSMYHIRVEDAYLTSSYSMIIKNKKIINRFEFPTIFYDENGRINSFKYEIGIGKILYRGDDETYKSYVFLEWNDKTHYLFPSELRKLVFQLMCIKEKDGRLPIEIWLIIFYYLVG
jgi:hypothetical protein